MCYSPHEGVNLTSGLMYSEGFSYDGRCIGALDDVTCGTGNFRLTLPIGNRSEAVCGMTRIEDSVDHSLQMQKKYLIL